MCDVDFDIVLNFSTTNKSNLFWITRLIFKRENGEKQLVIWLMNCFSLICLSLYLHKTLPSLASFSMTYFDYFSIFSSLSYQENIVIKKTRIQKNGRMEQRCFWWKRFLNEHEKGKMICSLKFLPEIFLNVKISSSDCYLLANFMGSCI